MPKRPQPKRIPIFLTDPEGEVAAWRETARRCKLSFAEFTRLALRAYAAQVWGAYRAPKPPP